MPNIATPMRLRQSPCVTPRLANPSAISSPPDLARDVGYSSRSSGVTPKQDTPTPMKPFLSTNITPRSGSRKARVGSNSSTPRETPSGTPSSSRPVSVLVTKDLACEDSGTFRVLGTASGGMQNHKRSGSTVSSSTSSSLPFRGISPECSSQGRVDTSPENSPMFFHASDAQQAPLRQAPAQPKPQGFMYANGDVDDQLPISPPSTASSTTQPRPRSNLASSKLETKVFPRKGQQIASPPLSRPPPTLTSFAPPAPRGNLARPPSPLKDFEVNSIASEKRSSTRSSAEITSPLTSPRSPISGSTADIARRASTKSSTALIYHKKNPSGSSIDSPSRRRSSLVNVELARPPSSTSPGSSMTSRPNLLHSIKTDLSPSTITSPISNALSSPTRPVSSVSVGEIKIDQLNTLAANARRERKVLDLEISNSSLLAINRTLEREMKKQKAELRRFRRLTSAGSLSMTEPMDMRLSSVTSTDVGSNMNDSSFNDEDDAASSTSLSPHSSDAESITSGRSTDRIDRASRRRVRDSQCLQQNLARHQEVLADSQRLNASLKRCLDWTEELISEGRRALSYTVRISDIAVGGRVLDQEDIGEDVGRGRALLSPGLEDQEAGASFQAAEEAKSSGLPEDLDLSLRSAAAAHMDEPSLQGLELTTTAPGRRASRLPKPFGSEKSTA